MTVDGIITEYSLLDEDMIIDEWCKIFLRGGAVQTSPKFSTPAGLKMVVWAGEWVQPMFELGGPKQVQNDPKITWTLNFIVGWPKW